MSTPWRLLCLAPALSTCEQHPCQAAAASIAARMLQLCNACATTPVHVGMYLLFTTPNSVRSHKFRRACDVWLQKENAMPGSKKQWNVWLLSRHSCLVCRLRRAPGCLRLHACWQTFAFLVGRPSTHGCSACGSVRYRTEPAPTLLPAPDLFCTCPPQCAVADARLGLA